jgi:hypothetical protein
MNQLTKKIVELVSFITNIMKLFIYSVLALVFFVCVSSCSSSKDARERRGLMMPKRSEMYVNKGRYKEIDYSNRDKAQKKRLKEQAKRNKKTAALKD